MARSTKRARRSDDMAAVQAPPHEDALDPQLLKAVSVVIRSQSALVGLVHVARSIGEFADPICDRWSLESVVAKSAGVLDEASAVRLLDRLSQCEWSGLTPAIHVQRGLHCVIKESNDGRMQIVDWWLDRYLPLDDSTAPDILRCAAYWNRTHVLERIEREGLLPDTKLLHLDCRHEDTAFWLHERGFSLAIDVCLVIHQNNLQFMRWTCEHKDTVILRRVADGLAIAATNNSIEMAQLLTEAFPETLWTEFEAEHYAAMNLDMIEWLMGYILQRARAVIANNERADYALTLLIDNMMVVSVKRGRLDIIQFLYAHPLHERNPEMLCCAAAFGHLAVVQWLHGMDSSCEEAAIAQAIKCGYFEIVKWLYGKRMDNGDRQSQSRLNPVQAFKFSIDEAADSGSLELVQWLHNHQLFGCSTGAMDAAATRGNLDIVCFLHEHRTEGCTSLALEGAVRGGNLPMVEWLFTNRKDISKARQHPILMDMAARYGHLPIVKWLHANRSDGCTINAVDSAARNGHLEVVKFLLENRNEGCSTEAIDDAASNGHLEILKYFASSRHMECSDPAIERAATNGHFHILLWLHLHGFDFDGNALAEAVTAGHVNIVRFLVIHCGLSMTDDVVDKAVVRQDYPMVEWIMKNYSSSVLTIPTLLR